MADARRADLHAFASEPVGSLITHSSVFCGQPRVRWNPTVGASGGGAWAASRWLVRLVAIPLNTARPGADPSWKEAVIRAAANPA